jgi:redox-sensitive bicupin YhaK (pirin superfamily)
MAGEKAIYHIGAQRYGYLVPATGSVEVNGAQIQTRDGVALSGVETIEVTALADRELVLVDAA